MITPDDAQTTNSMKQFYKFIKQKKMDHHGVSSLKVDGKLITDPKMKAEVPNKPVSYTHLTLPTNREV